MFRLLNSSVALLHHSIFNSTQQNVKMADVIHINRYLSLSPSLSHTFVVWFLAYDYCQGGRRINSTYLSGQIFQNSRRVNGSGGSNTSMAGGSVLEMTMYSADWELLVCWSEKENLFNDCRQNCLQEVFISFILPEDQHGPNGRQPLLSPFQSLFQLCLQPTKINHQNQINGIPLFLCSTKHTTKSSREPTHTMQKALLLCPKTNTSALTDAARAKNQTPHKTEVRRSPLFCHFEREIQGALRQSLVRAIGFGLLNIRRDYMAYHF